MDEQFNPFATDMLAAFGAAAEGKFPPSGCVSDCRLATSPHR